MEFRNVSKTVLETPPHILYENHSVTIEGIQVEQLVSNMNILQCNIAWEIIILSSKKEHPTPLLLHASLPGIVSH